MSRRITARQAAFCRGVAAGKSATQAAKEAGYSQAYANRQASQLLDNPLVRAELETLNRQIAAPEIATIAHRQTWWTQVMRDETRDMKARLRASELLGRSQGDFIEKVDVTSKGTRLGTASDDDIATLFVAAMRDPTVRQLAMREFPDVVEALAAGGAVTP